MSTRTGTTTYTVQAVAGGQVTITGTTDYTVAAPTGVGFTGTTDYVVVDPSTRQPFNGSTQYTVTSRPVVSLRVGTELLQVRLGIRQGDSIVWLSPAL